MTVRPITAGFHARRLLGSDPITPGHHWPMYEMTPRAHRPRNRAERLVSMLKQVRRVATRHGKPAASFLPSVERAALRI